MTDEKLEDILSRLHAPNMVAPVKPSPAKEALDNWPICWGNSQIDGEDWYLVTDRVRASNVASLDFPQDAKIDVQFVADLINAYREGRLIPANTRPAEGAGELESALNFVEQYIRAFSSGEELPSYESACAVAEGLREALSTPSQPLSQAGDTTAVQDCETLSEKLSQLSLELSQRGWDAAAIAACDEASLALSQGGERS